MGNTKLSPQALKLQTGRYQHYKGGQYEVIGVGIHSETLEEYVVYRALYDDRLIWIRPLAMFFESVTVEGVTKPRFKYVDPSRV